MPRNEIDAPGYVPFEPRTEAQRQLRCVLRSQLRELRADPGQILHATFAGAMPRGSDIENVLFYNIAGEGAFVNLMERGVCFERDPEPPDDGVRYRYECVDAPGTFRHWRPARELAAFAADAIKPAVLAWIDLVGVAIRR